MSALEQLEALLDRYDADLKFDVATACCWSGTFRLTLTDPKNAPSRSITFHSAGGSSPEQLAEVLLKDVEAWLAEGGEPMPVPDWLK